MSVMQPCSGCDGRPGGCGYCRGSGTEPPTGAERDSMLGNALRILNDDGVSREPFSVIDGGKPDK